MENLSLFFKEYLAYLKRRIRIILFIGLIGLGLGLFYSFNYKPYYKANLSFMINETKSFSGNPLSALAGQLGMGGNGPGITEDKILFLLSTKRILGEAMLAPFGNSKERIGDVLAKTLHVNNAWKSDTLMDDFIGFSSKHVDDANFQEQKAMNQILLILRESNRMKFETVKKNSNSFVGSSNSGILTIDFESRNEELSMTFVNAIYQKAIEFYEYSTTKNLLENYQLISQKADSIKALMMEKEQETAVAGDAAFNVFKYQGRLPEARLRKEAELLNIMYAEIIKNKEIAKFNLDQEKPVFQLVDQPFAPLVKKEKSAPLFGFLGAFVMFIFGVGLWTTVYLFINRKKIPQLLN
ncbi:MAG: hypothetical protein K9J84_06740 [Bacteroidia bacterium]|nr:hypothetical protein [Bacteroidia bacterium]